MIENRAHDESFFAHHEISVFTPAVLRELVDDSDFQNGLALLRQGIHEIRRMNGVETTHEWQMEYTPSLTDSGIQLPIWESVTAEGREPFLLVDHNSKDGIICALEGRIYTFGGTGEKSMYLNWLAVRNTGTNDADTYSWRGKHAAEPLHDRLYEFARERDVKLIILGINPENERSIAFNTRQGFVSEEFDPSRSPDGTMRPYATERGAYIPPYTYEDKTIDGTPFTGVINYYTKRL